jgi:hypothetical protein
MLRNYFYIDERKLDSFAEQIRGRQKETVKPGKKLNLSITGLGWNSPKRTLGESFRHTRRSKTCYVS